MKPYIGRLRSGDTFRAGLNNLLARAVTLLPSSFSVSQSTLMKISLCYYICCVLLFRYSIAAPPGPSGYLGPNDDLPVNLNFLRETKSGGIIDHSGWKPPTDPHHSTSQRQSLPSISRSRGLLLPRVQPAVPDDHPNFTTLRLPPIQHDPSQAGPQGGSGHSYGYGPASPPQQQAPPHDSFPNQPSHAGPSQAQQQQAQAHSSPKKAVTMANCRMCNNFSYVKHSKTGELRKHMTNVGHIIQLDKDRM